MKCEVRNSKWEVEQPLQVTGSWLNSQLSVRRKYLVESKGTAVEGYWLNSQF